MPHEKKREYDTPPLPGGVWMTATLSQAVMEDHPRARGGKLKAVFSDCLEDGQGKPHRLRLYCNWMIGFQHDDPDIEKVVNEINDKQLRALFGALGVKDDPDFETLPEYEGDTIRVRVGRWVKRGAYWVPQSLAFEAVGTDKAIPF